MIPTVIRKTKRAAIKTHQWLTAKRIHWFVYGALILCALSIVVQLAYPRDKTLPLVRIDSVPVGYVDRQTIANRLYTRYEKTKITVDVPGKKSTQIELAKTGVVPNYADAAATAINYPLWQRLIPFSAAYKMTRPVPLPTYVDAEVFSKFSQDIIDACAKSPQDAAIEIKNGQVSLKSAQDGRVCASQRLWESMKTISFSSPRLQVPAVTVKPNLPDEKLKKQFDQAKTIVDRGVKLGSPAEQWQVPRETVASWLTVTTGEQIELTINIDAVKKYLSEYRGKTYIAPGQSTVHLLDGLEVRRDAARNGQGIDAEVTAKRISEALLASKAPSVIWTQITVLPPAVVYDRQYTQTHAGLQALIEQWDRDNAGRYGIIVRDLSGRGLNAELNPDRDFVTASTYKQFLAYAVMHKIEAGQMSFDDSTSTGLSVRGCIDEMILHSTNPCAVALQNQADWGYVHNFIRGQFPSTSLDNGASADDEKHSTVRDEVTFQTRLQAGTLEMNGDNHAYLLGLMKRQVYRGGIPAGVPGVAVANKVGFYDGYKHDIAIIYGPRGTYQLGVMSYGGADWRFADLSRRVAELMNR
jgi:beta-lactamase class A